MNLDFFRQLGKEAAKRTTSRSRSVKVFGSSGASDLKKALKAESSDARQLPWTYGEKRKKNVRDTSTGTD